MTDHLNAVALALREAGERFAQAAQELAPVAAELAAAEAACRVACDRAGVPSPQPPARELAAEVVHAALTPLRPYVPFVPDVSGERAAEALSQLGSRIADLQGSANRKEHR